MFIIRRDDLQGPEIAALLTAHMADMQATSPPESVHALDLAALRRKDIQFWTLWHQPDITTPALLAGCIALKLLDDQHGEIKSTRVADAFRGRGCGRRLVEHLLAEARQHGLLRVSLETGSMAFFQPARSLYQKFGFIECPPFADYQQDPNSVFMTLALRQ
ncbi:GNAT family N-acetyltransferase [Rheinheimera texasensis]|uniref:GNAT family N-acetyltransferase n=1 Tax=Rheinheimera texasensis TaxID=306205 RepID=UPI0004E1F859|nr:GNAT family N-acetyltransferase [Rheinheimera texasensis]